MARVVVVLGGLVVVVEDSDTGGLDVVVLVLGRVELTMGCDTLGPPDPQLTKIKAAPTRKPAISSRRADLAVLWGTPTSVRVRAEVLVTKGTGRITLSAGLSCQFVTVTSESCWTTVGLRRPPSPLRSTLNICSGFRQERLGVLRPTPGKMGDESRLQR